AIDALDLEDADGVTAVAAAGPHLGLLPATERQAHGPADQTFVETFLEEQHQSGRSSCAMSSASRARRTKSGPRTKPQAPKTAKPPKMAMMSTKTGRSRSPKREKTGRMMLSMVPMTKIPTSTSTT